MKLSLPTKKLLEAPDYRSFLKHIYQTNKALYGAFSYSYMAQRCQFASKSFLKEVIDGNKKLTLESGQKVARGLGLNRDWGDYLLCLIENDFAPERQEKLLKLKKKILSKKKAEDYGQADNLFEEMEWPVVYAALGTIENGASLKEIASRTNLKTDRIEAVLNHLIKSELVKKHSDRYLPTTDSAFFEGLGKSQFFKKLFLSSLESTHEHARRNFSDPTSLFYNISVSVDSKKVLGFKMELCDLLDRYTSDLENPNGNRILSLICSSRLI